MTVESVTYISDLDVNNPAGGDSISQGDDHIRSIKKSIKNTFPNVSEPVTATAEEINKISDFAATGNGVFARKYSGSPLQLMYAHNVSSVTQIGTAGYRVNFKKPTTATTITPYRQRPSQQTSVRSRFRSHGKIRTS